MKYFLHLQSAKIHQIIDSLCRYHNHWFHSIPPHPSYSLFILCSWNANPTHKTVSKNTCLPRKHKQICSMAYKWQQLSHCTFYALKCICRSCFKSYNFNTLGIWWWNSSICIFMFSAKNGFEFWTSGNSIHKSTGKFAKRTNFNVHFNILFKKNMVFYSEMSPKYLCISWNN